MTPYNHLTDREILRVVNLWPTTASPLSSLELELAARLENAVDYQDAIEERIAVLAAKYQIDQEDLLLGTPHDA